MDKTPRVADRSASEIGRRNFWILALHHIVLRVGWIFKTETVIMPGFLEALGVGGAVRGCLPVLNRIGQSVPQFLFARRVRRMPLQKWALVTVSLGQGLPWLALAAIVWSWPPLHRGWHAAAFLVIYFIFNVTFGNWTLLSGTIQGKLIPIDRRGRLLGTSNFWGCTLAAGAAALWLGDWLALGFVGYSVIFAVTGAAFVLAGLLAIAFVEPAVHPTEPDVGLVNFLGEAWRHVAADRNFRRLIAVVALFHMVLILFPHYIAFARLRLNAGSDWFVLWVVAQNLTNGCGSALVGPLSDRRGNRLALSLLTTVAAATPVVAIWLAHLPAPLAHWGRPAYWLVFLLLGFTPITQRIIVNYALEIAPPTEHAIYLGTVQLVQAFPLFLSPIFGWLIDATSFEVVFLAGSATILAGGVLAHGLAEPRAARGEASEAALEN
jgi:hypothetical protein